MNHGERTSSNLTNYARPVVNTRSTGYSQQGCNIMHLKFASCSLSQLSLPAGNFFQLTVNSKRFAAWTRSFKQFKRLGRVVQRAVGEVWVQAYRTTSRGNLGLHDILLGICSDLERAGRHTYEIRILSGDTYFLRIFTYFLRKNTYFVRMRKTWKSAPVQRVTFTRKSP